MVGIVKPFQHLKMSPADAKDGNASPPPLCIVDDSEQQDETDDSAEAIASDAKRANLEIATTASESLSISGAAQIQVAVSLVSNNSVGTSEKTMQYDDDTDTTPTSADMTHSLNTTTSTDITQPLNTPSPSDATVNRSPDKECNKQNAADADTRNASLVADHSDDSKPVSAVTGTNDLSTDGVDEPESEIRIEKCVSLALDLTTKAKAGKAADSDLTLDTDQPLDLSMKSKSGEISPKVLDLSIKKDAGSPKTTPVAGVTVRPISTRGKTVMAAANPDLQPKSCKPDTGTVTIARIPIAGSPSERLKIRDSDKQRIADVVIEDASVARSDTPKTVSRPRLISPSGTQQKLAPQACARIDSAESKPMKRCASLDATSTDVS